MSMTTAWTKINTTLTNSYYLYYSSSSITKFPPKIHTLFSAIDIILCLDFIPATSRLTTAIYQTTNSKTVTEKIYALSHTITESVGMFSDLYWVIDELKTFRIIKTAAFSWMKSVYKVLCPLQYIWLIESVYKTYQKIELTTKFTRAYSQRTNDVSTDERNKNVETAFTFLLQNYKTYQSVFDLNISLISSNCNKEKTLEEVRQKIVTSCFVGEVTTAINISYYTLSLIKFAAPATPLVPYLLVACCISSLAMGILT